MLSNYLFSTFLEDGEQIIIVCHKHIWAYRAPLFREFVLGITVPVLFYFLYPPLYTLWFLWLIVGVIRFLYVLSDWYFDAWLVTNMGVIDLEWNGFFSKSSNRIEYQSIDGISYTIQGFWQTVLNFGLVQIQQLGGGKIVNMEDAYHPKRMERELMRLQAKYVDEKTRRDHEALKVILTSLVQTTMKK